jgi:hypothetical protein
MTNHLRTSHDPGPPKWQVAGAFIFGILFFVLLAYSFIFVKEPTRAQAVQLSLFLAVFAGLAAFFIAGSLTVKGNLWGLNVRAAGGLAFAIVVYYVSVSNIFPVTQRADEPLTGKLWVSYAESKLEDLVKVIRARSGSESVVYKSGSEEMTANFVPGAGRWSGDTWGELIESICRVRKCLICEKLPSKTLVLGVHAVEVEKKCDGGNCVYLCKL